MITLLIFFLTISQVTPLSFDFTSFDPSNHNIKYEGDASVLDSIIQLTPNQLDQTGLATYNVELMHLWDNSSGILADFTTNFSFSIDSRNNATHADGFAFFISPPQYRMPDDQQGSGIGLASGNLTLNSTVNPFVAIEFDTYYNPWDDMEDDHVGIDINSLKSSKSLKWYSSVMDGRIMDARITYNSSFTNLCVYFTGISDNIIVEQNLCYHIDLRNYLPEWVILGFSAATGTYTEFHRIHSWSFKSNFQTHQNITNLSPPPTTVNHFPPRKGKNWKGIVIGTVVGAIILALVGFGCFWLYKNKKQSRKDKENVQSKEQSRRGIEIDSNNPTIDPDSCIIESQDNKFKRVTGAKNIPHEVLVRATNNFDEKEKLGEGGFGSVFKGYLEDLDTFVAVKRVSEGSIQGISEYAAEVMILSQLRHRNLVQLVGWCHEKREILLVYEWLPNRSLDFHLFDKEKLLKWEQRYKIGKGLACGLHYLHEGWRQCVLHRDIKSSNVMLDSDFNPMLGDFGLARIIDHDARSQTLQGGSHGYIAPECLDTGKSSKESDVFSFGVVALEIACGRKPYVQRVDGSQVHIVKWVWELYGKKKLMEAADEKLHGQFTKKQMEYLMIVGLWCAHPDFSFRPSMMEAINVLNFDAELPDLPSKFPGPTHFLPTQGSSTISSSVNVTFRTAPTQNSSYDLLTDSSKLTSPTSPLILHRV